MTIHASLWDFQVAEKMAPEVAPTQYTLRQH